MQARSVSGTRYSRGLNVSPHILLINGRREKGTSIMERSDGHHLHHVIKLSITNNVTNWY